MGTSLALTRDAFPSADAAWVVAQDHPEHAVVAATAAAAHRSPLLVVDGDADGLPAAHADLLRELGVSSVTVVGPSAAVSAGIVDDLAAVVGADHVVRAGGEDRYAVAARVNALAWPDLPRGVAYLANGRAVTTAFSGALLAGLLAAAALLHAPLLRPVDGSARRDRQERVAGGAGRRRELGPRDRRHGWRPAAASPTRTATGSSSTAGTRCRRTGSRPQT